MVRIAYFGSFWLLTILSLAVSAQQDSIIHQNWNRYPNADIENTSSNQKQIITKEQILYSGYTLVSDLLQLIDGFTMSTWNGDRWNLQANGTGTYQNQNWTLLLDGQRIDLMKIDAQHINTMGISVYDIERIEVVNTVGNYLSEFNETGIIHMITKKNKDGITYRGFISNGNEIGDPHMNVFNNLGLNVHEYGTNFGNYLGLKKNKWDLKVNQYSNIFFYRDTTNLLFPLVRQYNPDADFANTILSGKVQATYTSTRVTHQLIGIANRASDVIMPAGIFNPITGKNNYNTIGYTMRYAMQKGILQYRGSLMQRSFIGTDQNWISHEQHIQTHNLNFTQYQYTPKGKKITQFGMAYDYITTQLLDTTNKNNTTHSFVRPYFSYTYPLTKRSNLFTDVSVSTNFKYALPKISLGYYKQNSIITNWSVSASFSQRNQIENNSYFLLISIMDTNSLHFAEDVSSLTTVDYFYNLNISKYFKVSFNSGLKYLHNELFFQPRSTVNSNSPLLLNTEINDMQQTRWINRINLHYDLLKNTQVDLNYLYTSTFNDKSSLQNSIPKHRFSAIVYQSLPSRFYLWGRYNYQSSTSWINPLLIIQPINNSSQDFYTQISSTHTFDFGITKKLLKEYLTTNLTVRNIFNTNERYQANGASFYMRLFISVKLNIEGIVAKTE